MQIKMGAKNEQKQGIDTNKTRKYQPEKLAKIRPIVYL
jgi:hypothetical protein